MQQIIPAHVRLILLVVWIMGCGCASLGTVPGPQPQDFSGLQPLYPGMIKSNKGGAPEFVATDSLQPTMRWESFQDFVARELNDSEFLHRISHVTYDLRIWHAGMSRSFMVIYPDELVYSRQGIAVPFHHVEQPLKPSTNYFWSIRARFDLDGHPRVMQWGTVYSTNPYKLTEIDWSQSASRIPDVPNPYYYRFCTPEAPKSK